MAGTNCNSCVFSQWDGQNQVGCALNRLDKYENVGVLNDEKNGFYKVLPHNLCTAKRDKKWLSENPRNPTSVVRKELYPTLQLIVIVDSVCAEWMDFFDRLDVRKYSVIDILLFDLEPESIQAMQRVAIKAKIFLHLCLPVDNVENQIHHHLNYRVRQDCQFYVTVDTPQNTYINDWPDKLDYYLNDYCHSLLMTYDLAPYDMEADYNNRLVYTPLHIMLGGYGNQSISEKVGIYCFNNNEEELIQFVDDIWDIKDATTKST